MKITKALLALALITTIGCAKKSPSEQAVQEANVAEERAAGDEEEADREAPAKFTATPGASQPGRPGTGGISVCDSPECHDACAEAGKRMSLCAEAFAQGCMSDRKPEDFDCDWENKDLSKQKRDKGDVDPTIDRGDGAAEDRLRATPAEDTEARTEELIDNKNDEEDGDE